MAKQWIHRLQHMLIHVDQALQHAQNRARQPDVSFDQAILYCLLVIGEAAGQIPKTIHQAHPHIKWREIIGLRNILIHQYEGTDEVIIQKIVADDLRELRQQIAELMTLYQE